MFAEYFAIFPWDSLPRDAMGFDAGCGSGRWAALVARRVGWVHCIDASTDALVVAQQSLAGLANVSFHAAPLEAMPLPDNSMDFGYSLGVLHHLSDPAAGLAACVRTLKRGAPMLLYIYYAFDNRPTWFRLLWRASDGLRRLLSRAPFRLKSLEIGRCRTSRRLRLLAIGAGREGLGAARRQYRQLAARRLSLAQLLCDAQRRARPLRHTCRASHDASPDQGVDGRGRAARHTLSRCRAVLVRGRAQGIKMFAWKSSAPSTRR